MSKEAMKLALEALVHAYHEDEAHPQTLEAIAAIREALAEQPAPVQQEPVAWMEEMPTQEGETRSVRMTTLKDHATLEWGNPIPLYTSPPAQRTWVGLTIEEIASCCRESTTTQLSFAQELEAKLKEKNT